MEANQDVIEIYQLLRHQEIALFDLHRSLRAIVQTLGSPEFLEAYQRHYEEKGSSEVALDYAGTLRLIDETVRRLSAQ